MKARRKSRCPACRKQIKVGDDIHHVGGAWSHTKCTGVKKSKSKEN